MRDVKLLAEILGLHPPWRVNRVRLDRERSMMVIELVSGPDGAWECPECRQPVASGQRVRRTWQHLDVCQYRSEIVADVPEVTCERHGVQSAWVPWADSGSRQTTWAERRAIERLFGLVEDFDTGSAPPASARAAPSAP